ncbi:unnamed protein product [Prunus armeniaca]
MVTLHDDIPNRQVRIGTSLPPELRSDLFAFLRLNSVVFVWSYNDMPGISPDIISHRLSINPTVRPVRQKCCAYDPEQYEAMRAKVDKLSTIGFIKEVDYPTWLANVAMVHKPKKGWHMCVDYTNLNRACPKDSINLPRIDQLVDTTASHALLSFMNAYSGYNQIFMHPENQAHTSFITDHGLYCYKVMPFGLKNAGATYQCLALKGSKRSITWTAECDKACSELKEYMSRAPLLSTPKPGDIFMIYLSISATAVISVLIWPEESAEHPMHYVSKALQDAEVRYPDIEKLAFALVVSTTRLRPYFQAHTIHVLTNQPLRQVL